MIIIACILIAFGALLTFLSKSVAETILSGKREPTEADITYTKLSGFALVLVGAILVFV